MVHDLGEVVRVQRVQDVEHVVARWPLPFWELFGEVRVEDRVVLERGEDILYRQFVVVRHLYLGDRSLLEKLLLANQDILEEVLIHNALVREVVLQTGKTKMDEYGYVA